MKDVNLFLISGGDLADDCQCLLTLVERLDEVYEHRGFSIRCWRWKNENASDTKEHLPEEIEQEVRSSDMCICLFRQHADPLTVEAFRQAREEYKRNGTHPKTYIYIRALADGNEEDDTLISFKEELFQQHGCYWCSYNTEDRMKLHFVIQMEQLLNTKMGLPFDRSELRLNHGVVTFYGIKVADYAQLFFVSSNSILGVLKEEFTMPSNAEVPELRAKPSPEVDANSMEEAIRRESNARFISKIEKLLLEMARVVNRVISSDMPINERKRLIIEYFEKGEIKYLLAIVNAKELDKERKSVVSEITTERRRRKKDEKKLALSVQTLREQAEDYLLIAKARMLAPFLSNNYSKAIKAYESAIEIAEKYLTDEETMGYLLEYADFLLAEKERKETFKVNKKALDICRRLVKDNPATYEPMMARIQNQIGGFYSSCFQFKKSEEMRFAALKTLKRLARENPEVFEPKLATVLKDLGHHYDGLNFEKCMQTHLEAVEVYQRLAERSPAAYEPDLANCQDALGNSYHFLGRHAESEQMLLAALEIRKRLARENPKAYEPDLAESLYNVSEQYFFMNRNEDCERYGLAALKIYSRLVKEYPKAFYYHLANVQRSLGMLYHCMFCDEEGEKRYIASTEMIKLLPAYPANTH